MYLNPILRALVVAIALVLGVMVLSVLWSVVAFLLKIALYVLVGLVVVAVALRLLAMVQGRSRW